MPILSRWAFSKAISKSTVHLVFAESMFFFVFQRLNLSGWKLILSCWSCCLHNGCLRPPIVFFSTATCGVNFCLRFVRNSSTEWCLIIYRQVLSSHPLLSEGNNSQFFVGTWMFGTNSSSWIFHTNLLWLPVFLAGHMSSMCEIHKTRSSDW